MLDCAKPSYSEVHALARSLPPTRMSVTTLKHAAMTFQKDEEKILTAKFVRRETLARRTHMLSMLLRAEIKGGKELQALAHQPQIVDLKVKHWERLREILAEPSINSLESEERYASRSQTILDEQNGESRLAFGQALEGLRVAKSGGRDDVEISGFLDAFLTARIATNFRTEHYLASRVPRPGYAGIIQLQCSPVALCKELVEATQLKLHSEMGAAPAIEIIGDADMTFTCVPSHLRFALGELLDNAAKATIRFHLEKTDGRLTTLPSVRVIFAASDENVTVKVADTAGGIPRSKLSDVWSYRCQNAKKWGQGIGLGLPLARLFATYLGGRLSFVPMEGHGTDCYAIFNRREETQKEVMVRALEGKDLPEDLSETVEERRTQGKWRSAIRLFDAQARKGVAPSV